MYALKIKDEYLRTGNEPANLRSVRIAEVVEVPETDFTAVAATCAQLFFVSAAAGAVQLASTRNQDCSKTMKPF